MTYSASDFQTSYEFKLKSFQFRLHLFLCIDTVISIELNAFLSTEALDFYL